MQIVESGQPIPAELKGCVMTLGNFDGLHLGHRALVDRVVGLARRQQANSVVMTFEPHPVKVLHPGKSFRELFPLADLQEQLAALGVSGLVIAEFSLDLAQLSAEDFLQQIIVNQLTPRAVVIGYDFRFGKNRAGDFNLMKEVLDREGIRVEQVGPVEINGEVISSTLVRRLLTEGQVTKAAELLGRPFELRGHVGSGDQRGRRLGFPTANLVFENELVPRVGVYLTEFVLENQAFASLTNVGYRPTFELAESPQRLTVESFLIDQNVNLYEQPARVRFLQWLREEKAFPTGEALACQIQEDLRLAREFFARHRV